MSEFINALRDELYEFFDKEVSPIIKKDNHDDAMAKQLVTKFNAKFSTKYKFIGKRYGQTIRISANFAPLGIIFFMADSKEGFDHYKFADPCYIPGVTKVKR